MITRTTAAGLALLALGVSGLDLEVTDAGYWTYQPSEFNK
jgi:hypothetical protein